MAANQQMVGAVGGLAGSLAGGIGTGDVTFGTGRAFLPK